MSIRYHIDTKFMSEYVVDRMEGFVNYIASCKFISGMSAGRGKPIWDYISSHTFNPSLLLENLENFLTFEFFTIFSMVFLIGSFFLIILACIIEFKISVKKKDKRKQKKRPQLVMSARPDWEVWEEEKRKEKQEKEEKENQKWKEQNEKKPKKGERWVIDNIFNQWLVEDSLHHRSRVRDGCDHKWIPNVNPRFKVKCLYSLDMGSPLCSLDKLPNAICIKCHEIRCLTHVKYRKPSTVYETTTRAPGLPRCGIKPTASDVKPSLPKSIAESSKTNTQLTKFVPESSNIKPVQRNLKPPN